MLEGSHIAISSSGLCSDAFVLHISLPLFVCSLFMVFYLLVNKLLCYMNGKDWISDKGLRWAEIVLLACSTRCFLNNFCHNRNCVRLTAFFWVLDIAMNGAEVREMNWKVKAARTLPCWHSRAGGGWCWEVRDCIEVVQLLSLVLLLNWRCQNHALSAGAGAQWFQVTHFPPTPVLTKKELWCLSWTHFMCCSSWVSRGDAAAPSAAQWGFQGSSSPICISAPQGEPELSPVPAQVLPGCHQPVCFSIQVCDNLAFAVTVSAENLCVLWIP